MVYAAQRTRYISGRVGWRNTENVITEVVFCIVDNSKRNWEEEINKHWLIFARRKVRVDNSRIKRDLLVECMYFIKPNPKEPINQDNLCIQFSCSFDVELICWYTRILWEILIICQILYFWKYYLYTYSITHPSLMLRTESKKTRNLFKMRFIKSLVIYVTRNLIYTLSPTMELKHTKQHKTFWVAIKLCG